MLYRLVRPMRRKGSRNEYFQQRIPADVKQRLMEAQGGQRVLEFQVAGETVRKAVTGHTKSIKFSLRTSDPTVATPESLPSLHRNPHTDGAQRSARRNRAPLGGRAARRRTAVRPLRG